MPPAKKRKTETAAVAVFPAEPESAQIESESMETTIEEAPPKIESTVKSIITTSKPAAPAREAKAPSKPSTDAAAKASGRLARFRALQERAKKSSDQNLAEATKESQRLATDPSALHRKRDLAQYKLLKAETEDAGEDFERKRAWDWTIEESERWDKRLKKKAAHRDNNAFQDYRGESNKVYKRQLKDMSADMEKYDKEKMAAIEQAAASGGLDIVETEDGELIAVDKDGSFYSTADTASFAENKPDKAAVDRLVADMKKAEDARLRKRRERMAANGDDGDVTYINEKNKQFNQKLARFYNKYTGEIRDSFERGTMI